MQNQDNQEQIQDVLKEIRDILKYDTKSRNVSNNNQIIFSVFLIGMSAIIAGLVKIPVFNGIEILIGGLFVCILAIILNNTSLGKKESK